MNKNEKLTPCQKERYARQILIPQIGEKGQRRLLDSSVLIVGAGGLGSAQGIYLAEAGIGRIGIADFDKVALSNFNRQVLYDEEDIGKFKVEEAQRHLTKKNSDIEITAYNLKITEENAKQIIRDYDIVLDATDNFDIRYIINKICFILRKKWIFGGIRHFAGQIAIFDFSAGEGPCLNCFFPNSEEEPIPEIKEIERGVIGISPGIIGLYQAAFAIKILLGANDIKTGCLFIEDFWEYSRKEIKIPKNPHCPICKYSGAK